MPAALMVICCSLSGSMPITSTSGFDISSETCCSPISASPLATSTLTRPFGPPAANFSRSRHLFADAEHGQHALDMERGDAAAVERGLADRFGGEQRFLQRVGGRHVGMRRALLDGKADAGARDVGAVPAPSSRRSAGRARSRRPGSCRRLRPCAAAARACRTGRSSPSPCGRWRARTAARARSIAACHRGGDQRLDLGGAGGRGRHRAVSRKRRWRAWRALPSRLPFLWPSSPPRLSAC